MRDIERLRMLDPDAFWRAVESRDERSPGAPRLESLVFLVRERELRGDPDAAWRVMAALVRRISGSVARHLGRAFSIGPQDADEVLRDLAAALYVEWRSVDAAHEFWEIRFGVCLKRRVIDAAKRYWRTAQTEVHLEPREDGHDPSTDPLEAFADPNATDPQVAAEVISALAYLPEKERTALYLRHYHSWGEEEIGRHLGVTSRSVRNYLARAEVHLKEWRGASTERI